MSTINHNVIIVVKGTKNSEILDYNEEFEINFTKGEALRDDLNGLDDLINNVITTSQLRGDIVKSIIIDGIDIIADGVISKLQENNFLLPDSLPEICSLPFFINGDQGDIEALVNAICTARSLTPKS
jgi:hypothetical protein